ncbi:PNPOx family protein [Tsukamurella soli]|uniref:Deazaflavin-dependent oxidoreductase, nitroreductase family n=1 Tax=Tsukamurella soli TaxID=644556 RepID=A0ABP8JQP2_9ACTN
MSRAGTAQTMPLQNVMNSVIRVALRAPFVSKGIGRYLLTIHVVGRKTGRHYDLPVAYTRHDGALLVGTPFAWGRNLRTGDPVEIDLLGKRRTADVRVVSDEAGVTELYGVIAKANRNFATFNDIGFGPSGEPDPAALHRAFEGGARVFVLALR